MWYYNAQFKTVDFYNKATHTYHFKRIRERAICDWSKQPGWCRFTNLAGLLLNARLPTGI
jgi:hypothetical protein